MWWFDRDSDPFLQSLENKHDAALLLSSELAACLEICHPNPSCLARTCAKKLIFLIRGFLVGADLFRSKRQGFCFFRQVITQSLPALRHCTVMGLCERFGKDRLLLVLVNFRSPLSGTRRES